MVRDLQWGKWRYLNIIREQGSERLTMGEVEVFECGERLTMGKVDVFEYN